jgi:glycogen(starch) synthase
MRIALISYEFPPDTAFGGIGTYAGQAATLLAQRGHQVEVFAASAKRAGHFADGPIALNLIGEMDRAKCPAAIAQVCAERHAVRPFAVAESPECFAEGHVIRQAHPNLPLIIKLHTPSEMLERLEI